MGKSKLKLFVENFIVYGFGGIIGKMIPLIMVPIVTRIMPSSEYFGISDLSTTVVSFASALAVMGMYDAMYRMFFDKEDIAFKKNICSTALIFTLGTSLVIFLAMVLLRKTIALYAFGNENYSYLVYVTAMATLVGATNSIVAAPTRMQNKKKVYIVMNTVSPVLSYFIAIPLLLNGYYVIALPLAGAIAAVTSEGIFLLLNRDWFSTKYFRKDYLKPLLHIAVPTIPTFLMYWLFNSSNKLLIVNFLGAAASGIFSVGSKLGQASQLIYLAFSGGWQYFAFSTMKEENQIKNNSIIFEYLGVISFVCAMFVFALSQPIYELLFEEEYISGYIVAPYLFLAPLLQMLFQVAGNQFLVIKKTWPISAILFAGAILNVVLGVWLIPTIGIEGAAIATLIGYAVSDVICVIVLQKMKLHINSKRFLLAAILMVGYVLIWRFITLQHVIVNVALAVLVSAVFAFLYRSDLISIVMMIKNERKRN